MKQLLTVGYVYDKITRTYRKPITLPLVDCSQTEFVAKEKLIEVPAYDLQDRKYYLGIVNAVSELLLLRIREYDQRAQQLQDQVQCNFQDISGIDQI